MARPLRLSFENAAYHITARGNRRENTTPFANLPEGMHYLNANSFKKGVFKGVAVETDAFLNVK